MKLYSNINMTRAEVHDEIKRITEQTQDLDAIKTEIVGFLKDNECTDFEIQQILNDLTSYPEYLALVN